MNNASLWSGLRAFFRSPETMKRWRRERRKRMFARPYEDLFDWGLDRDFQKAMERSMSGWSIDDESG